MTYGLSTHAQRLAWDHADLSHDHEADPCLDELVEVEDAAFRHFDQYVFALTRPTPPSPLHNGLAGGGATDRRSPSSVPVDPATPFEHHMWEDPDGCDS